jgi:uncharacterized membrane protein
MRRAGYTVFAATMVAVGLVGLIRGAAIPIWLNVPKGAPAREVLLYLADLAPLACGIGLLWRRTAVTASRVLLAFLVGWLALFDAPALVRHVGLPTGWPVAERVAFIAPAWVLCIRLVAPSDAGRARFATGARGLRIARALFGLALIWFGIGHFTYLQRTVSLVPGWIPWHLFWAYCFGCTFLAAGVALVIGVYARLAAALSALQLGLFTVLVWVPVMAAGHPSPSDWSEFVVSGALAAAAWVVADSYGGTPWFAARIADSHPRLQP